MKKLLLITAAILMQGCASTMLFPEKMVYNQTGEEFNSMLGKTEKELRMTWGPPDRKMNNASAGTVFYYNLGSITHHNPSRAYVNVEDDNIYGIGQKGSQYTGRKWIKFFVENGRVYRWQSNNVQTKYDKNKSGRPLGMLIDIILIGTVIGFGTAALVP
jgi:hypothetical protein